MNDISSIDSFSNYINHFEKLVAPSEKFASHLQEVLHGRQLSSRQKDEVINSLILSYKLHQDPLQHWLDYIHFIKSDSFKHFLRETIATNADYELFLVMKRCTFALLHHPKYANDERFVRIIVIYADSIRDSEQKEALFSFYYTNNVGILTSIFWTSWAFVLEKHYDHKAAKLVYNEALKTNAQPRDVIIERYNDFQHRAIYYGIELGNADFDSGFDDLFGDSSSLLLYQNSNKSVPIDCTSSVPQNEKALHKRLPQSDEYIQSSNKTQLINPRKRKKKMKPKTLFPSNSNNNMFTIYEDVEETQHEDLISTSKIGNHNKVNGHTKRCYDKDPRVLQVSKQIRCNRNGLSFEESRAKQMSYRLLKSQRNFNLLCKKRLLASHEEKSFEEIRAGTISYKLIIGPNENFNICTMNKCRGTSYLSLHKKDLSDALINLEKSTLQQEDVNIKPHVIMLKSNLPRGLKGNVKFKTKFQLVNEEYVIINKLGSGCFGTVLLCLNLASKEQIALKIQKEVDSLAWEFEILNRINRRIDPNLKYLFPITRHLTGFMNGAIMGMTAASSTGVNLLDVVNAYNCSVPELLVVHYTARMLKHIESLHLSAKVLHCDIKPDNWVLTSSSDCEFDIMLIDFGRAIDLDNVRSGSLYGKIMVEGLQCGSMLLDDQWLFDLDCHGICVCSYTLLYGTYLEMEMKSMCWHLNKPLRRYWQKSLWEQFFSSLLNTKHSIQLHEYSTMLKALRQEFEVYLNMDNIKNQLKAILIQQRTLIGKKKTNNEHR